MSQYTIVPCPKHTQRRATLVYMSIYTSVAQKLIFKEYSWLNVCVKTIWQIPQDQYETYKEHAM